MDSGASLVLVGPMGAGKSVAGSRLAARLCTRFIDLDAGIECDAGATIVELFAREGEPAFREREHRALEAALAVRGGVIATGGGAVLDIRNRRLLGERARVAWLRADTDTQWRRLSGCTGRPLLQVADRAATLRRLAAERAPLYAEVADFVLDTDDLDEDAVVDALETMFRTLLAGTTTR